MKIEEMTVEDLKRLIYKFIEKDPSVYPLILSVASTAFSEYKKGLDQMEANLLLLCGLIDKKSRERILKRINPAMFHPLIVEQLQTRFDPKKRTKTDDKEAKSTKTRKSRI